MDVPRDFTEKKEGSYFPVEITVETVLPDDEYDNATDSPLEIRDCFYNVGMTATETEIYPSIKTEVAPTEEFPLQTSEVSMEQEFALSNDDVIEITPEKSTELLSSNDIICTSSPSNQMPVCVPSTPKTGACSRSKTVVCVIKKLWKIRTCPNCNRKFKVAQNDVRDSINLQESAEVRHSKSSLCPACREPASNTNNGESFLLDKHQNEGTSFTCTCEHCNKPFYSLSSFTEHMVKCRSSSKKVCGICDKIFRGLSDLNSHMQTHAEEDIVSNANSSDHLLVQNRVEVCTISSGQNVKPEKEIEHKQRASTSQKRYSNKIDSGHSQSNKVCTAGHTTGKQMVQCQICRSKLTPIKASSAPKKMDKASSAPKKMYTLQTKYCKICNREFASVYFEKHIKIHTRVKPKIHPCNICSERFATINDLRKHHTGHTQEKPYVCKYCSKEFSHAESLLSHIKLHI